MDLIKRTLWCSIAILFGAHISEAREEDPTGAERSAMLIVVNAALMYSDDNRGKSPEALSDLEPYIGDSFKLPLEELVLLRPGHRLRPDVLALLPTTGGVIVGYEAGDVELIRSVVRPGAKRSDGILSERNLLIVSAAGNLALLGLFGRRWRLISMFSSSGGGKPDSPFRRSR